MKDIVVRQNALTPRQFLELYSSVGWDTPCMEQIETALERTLATFLVCDDNQPVGMVRLIGDGAMSFYLKDFAVIPVCQSKGVGTLLMKAVETFIREMIRPGWAVSLELISTKEAFRSISEKDLRNVPVTGMGQECSKWLKKRTIQ